METEMMKLHQLNALRIIKLEYELMTLKNMVFKNIANQTDAEFKDVESLHESVTHVALLANIDSICESLSFLGRDVILKHLKIED